MGRRVWEAEVAKQEAGPSGEAPHHAHPPAPAAAPPPPPPPPGPPPGPRMGTLGIALGLDAPRFGSKSPAGGYLFPDDLMGIFISRGPPLGTEHLFRP